MIVVTGATGGVGGRVAWALAARGPAGEGRAAFVSRDDVADIAAEVLAEPEGHDGRSHDVTGPVREILGRAPRTRADVLREHPETIADLRR